MATQTKPQTQQKEMEKLDFIGQVLCPLKGIFREGYDNVAANYEKQTGKTLFSYVPTVCGSDAPPSETRPGDILQCKDIASFPDVAASCFFGDYFSQTFRERFLGKGYFELLERPRLNQDFADLDIEDPEGEFNLYSGYPTVFLVDKKRLGNRPVPRTWEDLLNPIYENDITIGGGHGRISDEVPLYLFQQFGMDGLKKLEHNVRTAAHPAEMAKRAGTANTQGTAIYVMLLFFARACGKTDETEIVYPQDGVIFSPAFILVRRGMTEKYRMLIDYVTGSAFGALSAQNGFPVVVPDVDNRLPAGVKLRWLGWDFIHSHNMDALKQQVCAPFEKYLPQT